MAGLGTGLGQPLKNGARVLELDSWAAAVIDELGDTSGDIHVAKYAMSGFWDTPLDAILRNLQITTLLFAGVNLDQCVLCTLQDASFRGYDCLLLEDCAATTSPEYCAQAALYNIRQCFGFSTMGSLLCERLATAPDQHSLIRKGFRRCLSPATMLPLRPIGRTSPPISPRSPAIPGNGKPPQIARLLLVLASAQGRDRRLAPI
jgi:hypothetical protein